MIRHGSSLSSVGASDKPGAVHLVVTAVQWFQKAADLGNPEGLYGLAGAYESGSGGVHKDVRKAFVLYVQSALLGEKFAFAEVARCYKYGIGVTTDEELAGIWLDRAIQLKVPI